MEALTLKGVRKRFGRVQALRNISFSVREGEIFGFIGPNGAGKSTTMKIIMGFVKPDEGEVLVFGKSGRSDPVAGRVGFLPENPYFYTNVTGREFLEFVRMITSASAESFWEKVDYYADRLHISWALDKKLSSYSKGMLQRFGLLQAIVYEPDLLILDEPMSGLDPIGRRLVMDLLLELRDRGKTVFFSTHILPDVERICDRVAIVVNGEVVDVLDRSSLTGIEEIFMDRVRSAGVREVR